MQKYAFTRSSPDTGYRSGIRALVMWIFRLLAALIMLQTLYFKFTAHPQSVHLFTLLGMEPWGRIGIGVLELIASGLILYPVTTGYGAVLGMGLMSGAIFFHLTRLGIKFDGDYVLFGYAVTAFISCAILAFFYRLELLRLIQKVAGLPWQKTGG